MCIKYIFLTETLTFLYICYLFGNQPIYSLHVLVCSSSSAVLFSKVRGTELGENTSWIHKGLEKRLLYGKK